MKCLRSLTQIRRPRPIGARTILALSTALLLLAGAPEARAAVTIYGMSGPGFITGNQLLSIDPATGTGTAVGPTGTDGVEALEILPNGTFVAVSWNGQGPFAAKDLFTIDPTTGAASLIGSIRDPNEPEYAFVEGLAYGHGALYGSADNDADPFNDEAKLLVRIPIDPATGLPIPDQAEQIGAFGPEFRNVEALAFSPDGILYGGDIGTEEDPRPSLITIDITTGAATRVAFLPDDLLPSALDFGPDGLLYAAFIPSRTVLPDGTLPSPFGTIDPVTGAVTVIGPIGFDLVQGLAVVPEPGSLALLGLGGLVLLAHTRRRRSTGLQG